ncbi:MAG: SDR family oxidoreductase, partial [Spirochaetales bacterium]|nr:SDR family oxidoreductase [Spirochaetales bacterium]
LEHFARYLSIHLLPYGGRCNVIRFGTVKTPSFDAIFGEDFFKFAEHEGVTGKLILKPEDCGKAVLALCSGLLDAVNGQTITVDYGLPFQDNLMMRYLRMKDKENCN